MRRAFTLIETLAVIAIIVVLAAMIMAGAAVARRTGQVNAARALVGMVAGAIASYGQRSFDIWDDGASAPRMARAWDVDKDYLLDGVLEPAVFWQQVPAASATGAGPVRDRLRYRGFVVSTALPGLAGIRASDQVLLDPWKRPLHIAWAAQIYGDEGFCVWSRGKDPDDPADDIRSREPR